MAHEDTDGGAFRVGPWLVEPSRNRLSRGDASVQVEPKMMDVLTLLASRAGAVVSKREIDDAVWADVFVSESVITRAIAGLRRALGDDASAPSFIETIPKRGYRLMAPVRTAAAASSEATPLPTAPSVRRNETADPPFAPGQWVRGPAFVGRGPLLAEILDGPRRCHWVLGTRTVGKTSLLRQLEHLTETGRPEIAVFWDLQGATGPDDLAATLDDALLDAAERLSAVGIDPATLHGDDAGSKISALRRALGAGRRRLLLLCDETEELVDLGHRHPAALRRLRRAFQAHDDLRTVLVSSPRLWELASPTADTSPFLHGFTPPVYLGAFVPDEAEELIGLAAPYLPEGTTADPTSTARIRDLTGDHPALLQLACSRWIEAGDLDRALDAVAADRSVRSLFEVDHALLSDAERRVLAAAARDPIAADDLAADRDASGALYALEQLRLVRRDADDGVTVAGRLLRDWLRSRDPAAP